MSVVYLIDSITNCFLPAVKKANKRVISDSDEEHTEEKGAEKDESSPKSIVSVKKRAADTENETPGAIKKPKTTDQLGDVEEVNQFALQFDEIVSAAKAKFVQEMGHTRKEEIQRLKNEVKEELQQGRILIFLFNYLN